MYMFDYFHNKTLRHFCISAGLLTMLGAIGPVMSHAQTLEPETPVNPEAPSVQEDIPSILQAPDPEDISPPKSLPEISDLLRDRLKLRDESLRHGQDGEESAGELPSQDEALSKGFDLLKKPLGSEDEAEAIEKPDYSQLSEAQEREVRLDLLFERLGAEEDTETAGLVAEDIWAIWLESGSATVNYILRRGTAAQKRGDPVLARRMYDYVTTLSPEYAEGWSRSARLALEEKDFNRAFVDVGQALIYEPRHFYALWTLGNVCEQLDLQLQALEAYKEANRLYPELTAVKDRLSVLEQRVEGDVL